MTVERVCGACALIKTNEENPPPVEKDLFEQSRERPVMKWNSSPQPSVFGQTALVEIVDFFNCVA